MVSLRTPQFDTNTWERLGCAGWSFGLFTRLQNKIRLQTYPAAHPRDRNQISKDWLQAAHRALGVPLTPDFNDDIASPKGLTEAAGWTPLSYNPDNGYRGSASVTYIHPILRGDETRRNLVILTNAWVSRIEMEDDTAVGVNLTTHDGARHVVRAGAEVILCAGAFDTPRLMLLSGLGPREHLQSVRIPVVKDIPGVGQNLQDHPSSLVVYDLYEPVSKTTATHSDVLAFLRTKPEICGDGDDGKVPDLEMHMWQLDFCDETSRVGYERPKNAFCFFPVVLRPKQRGKLYLKSNDPHEYPALDFKYFEDPEHYDAEVLVAGIKAARKMAQAEPLKKWIKREIAPGPDVVSDEDLDAYARKIAYTIYHPACTTKMGDIEKDPLAVVDSRLNVRSVKNLRIADAGVFPTMITVNLMLTVLAVGERAAELIAEDAAAGVRQARL